MVFLNNATDKRPLREQALTVSNQVARRFTTVQYFMVHCRTAGVSIRITRSSGVVPADLGFYKERGENLRTHADLMIERKGFT